MKEERVKNFYLHHLTFILIPFLIPLGVFRNGCEDGDELVGFVLKGGQFGDGDDAAAGEELEPVTRRVEFFEAVADFGDELRLGPGSVGFAEVCADRGS